MYAAKSISQRAFPVLETAIFEKGIKKKVIAQKLGIGERTLVNKMTGISPFTWNEICILQNHFFPDITKEELMAKTNRTAERSTQ